MQLKKRLSNNFLTIWDCITLTSVLFSFHCSTHPHARTSWHSGNLRLCVCLWVCTRPPTYTPMPQDSLVLAPRTHTYRNFRTYIYACLCPCLPTTNGEMIFSNDLLAGIFFLLSCFFALFINEFHTYVYVILRIRPATQAQSKARYAM